MIFAHGVSSRGELPLPIWMFTWATAIALVVSFVALGVLWTRPQLAQLGAGRPLAQGSGVVQGPGLVAVLEVVARAAALALFLLALGAGLFGADSVSRNLLPVTLYVPVWVGAQLVSGLVGNLWGRISPITTLARLLEAAAGRLGHRPVPVPARIGQWPAAAGLLVFLFYELAHPSGQSPRALGWMLAVHTVISLGLAWRWGSGWIADHEPFAALFYWLGHMAPLFGRDGALAVRPPMSGLARMPVEGGTLAALLVVLGGTTFDGFSGSRVGRSVFGGRPVTWDRAALYTLGLLASIAVISALFGLGIWWTQRITGMGWWPAAVAFTPSLVPIVFGYAIAHYIQLLVDETQTFWFRLSDPFGRGWDLLGAANGQINFNLVSVKLLAWVQMLAILFGHIGAVVVAHDRSVELFDAGKSLRSQFAMLLVMVAYSTLGLYLLLQA